MHNQSPCLAVAATFHGKLVEDAKTRREHACM